MAIVNLKNKERHRFTCLKNIWVNSAQWSYFVQSSENDRGVLCLSESNPLRGLSRKCHRWPPVSVSFHRCPSVSVDVRQCPSVSVGVRRCPSVSVGVRRSPSVSVSIFKSLSVSVNVCQSLSVSVSICQCPSVSFFFGWLVGWFLNVLVNN